MPIEFLLIDLDDTILDFHKAEHIALEKTLRLFGIDPSDDIRTRYSQINLAHWQMLERGELTRQEVAVGRFACLFRELNVIADAQLASDTYAHHLSIGHYFLPGAETALEQLSGKYKLYLASNGTATTQESRLKSANIGHYFKDIFISQHLGADKPSPEFFRRAFARIPGFDPSRAMIVGDSLTSDIKGGNNAGIATCWVNPKHLSHPADIQVDHEIESLSQLEKLLDNLI